MMWYPVRCSSRNRAFTLIELLVVIGIIAVLISILMPVLGRMRERARQIKCASNVRQILFAVFQYANDNNGRLPIPGEPPDTKYRAGDRTTAYQAIAIIGNMSLGYVDYDWDHGTLWPYVDDSPGARQQLFNCPSDENQFCSALEVQWYGNGWFSTPWNRNFSYTFNWFMRDSSMALAGKYGPPVDPVTGWEQAKGTLITQIVHPSHKVLVVEDAYPATGATNVGYRPGPDGDPGLWSDNTLLSNRHLKRSNQGFADGHVETLHPEEMGFETNLLGADPPTNIHIMDREMSDRKNSWKRCYYGDLFEDPAIQFGQVVPASQ